MGFKATAAKIVSQIIARDVYREHEQAVTIQYNLLQQFLKTASATDFGKRHGFNKLKSVEDYQDAVPLRDYENFREFITLIAEGKKDVLWKGRPLYFCKSSGTTSGTKYIPVSKEQVNAMIRAARNSLLMYVAETGRAKFFDYKMIFLQGSPALEKHGEIPAGRLSGIVYHHVPFYVNANRMPSYNTNCIEEWETKVEAIARETLKERMSVISGIPPWCVMYFEKLLELSGKKSIKEVFPDFKLFVYGGVNYEPYRSKIEALIGFAIDSIETFPASEGFIAFQDSQQTTGLLLNVNGGIFYEFVRVGEVVQPNPKRITLGEVELGINYVMILTTNAGLWAYNLGDTVRFISLKPYRIIVTGRVKHFISAFGEHVIAEEVEYAMLNAMRQFQAGVTEFTVAPQVNPTKGLPYHEWLIEFSKPPANLRNFANLLDETLQQKNPYYKDLREGHILQQLKITPLHQNTFVNYMKGKGKLGGQNKVPRLTNNREIADELLLSKIIIR